MTSTIPPPREPLVNADSGLIMPPWYRFLARIAGVGGPLPKSGNTVTAGRVLAGADVGGCVEVGAGGSITIPNAVFTNGDVIWLYNDTAGSITITCTITTAYISGTNTDKASMALATRGLAMIRFKSGTECVVQGSVT